MSRSVFVLGARRWIPGHGVTSRFLSSSGFSASIQRTSIRHHHPPSRNQLSTMASATSFYDFKVLDSSEEEEKKVSLDKYKGKVVLIVNTASNCGFTSQYAGLQAVWDSVKEKYPDDFAILAFPCNQFGGQEPGSNKEIQNFCTREHNVTFPVMAKIDVKGKNAHPLYKWLVEERSSWLGTEIRWNFEKFLIGRDGEVKDRWVSFTGPGSLKSKILAELEKAA